MLYQVSMLASVGIPTCCLLIISVGNKQHVCYVGFLLPSLAVNMRDMQSLIVQL